MTWESKLKRSGFQHRGGGLKRGSGFKAKGELKRSAPLRSTTALRSAPAEPAASPSPFQAERDEAKRRALAALRKAERAAAKAGVDLSEWESGFLGDVAARVDKYGRAFGDPEKGARGQALSVLQGRKLREIGAKVKRAAPKPPAAGEGED